MTQWNKPNTRLLPVFLVACFLFGCSQNRASPHLAASSTSARTITVGHAWDESKAVAIRAGYVLQDASQFAIDPPPGSFYIDLPDRQGLFVYHDQQRDAVKSIEWIEAWPAARQPGVYHDMQSFDVPPADAKVHEPPAVRTTTPHVTNEAASIPTANPTAPQTIPLIYASEDGKPFNNFPASELERIKRRAGEIAPSGKEIWFILIRNGTWFPAAEVYYRPEKINGRLCSGQYSMIWREDSEKVIENFDHDKGTCEDYVWVVPPTTAVPNIAASQAPPVPDTCWLPFHRPFKDDQLIVSLVDMVQTYRIKDRKNAFPDANMPIFGIERDAEDFNVLVAWPDQGYEDFCIVKRTPSGFKATGWNAMYH